MKVLKKFEHKQKQETGRKYDWALILGGQHVMLEAGTDFEATGTNKDGEEFDRTDDFIATIKTRASNEGKTAKVDKVDGGVVVTAEPMTPEQIAKRDETRARLREARRAKNAWQASNGSAVEAASGVAPE